MRRRRSHTRVERLLALATILPACLILLPNVSYIPFWDAGDYLERLRKAALSDFSSGGYFLSGHPTFLYALLMSLPVKLLPWSIEAFNSTSIALFTISVLSFHALAERLRPGGEAALAAICYSLCPALCANVLFFTPDLGVAIFFPIYMALLARGPGLASALAGTMLANTKELGLTLCLASVVLYPLCYGFRRLGPRTVLFLPAPLLVSAILWLCTDAPPYRDDFVETLSLNPLNVVWEPKARAFLKDVFVLSFSWLPVLALTAGPLVLFLSGRLPERSARPLPLFLLGMFVACLYAITRVPTWNNPRYVLPAYALLFLLAYAKLPEVLGGVKARMVALLVFSALLLISNFRSIDPLSGFAYRPLDLGERKVWGLERLYARDQLVYNLEYLALHHLLNDLLAFVKPTSETVFAGTNGSDHYLLSYADPISYERSLGRPGDIALDSVEPWKKYRLVGSKAPGVLHFIDYPNLDSKGGLKDLRLLGYVEKERRIFDRAGLAIGYARLEHAGRGSGAKEPGEGPAR